MVRRLRWAAALLALAAGWGIGASAGEGMQAVEEAARRGHPRLILLEEDAAKLRMRVKEDAKLAGWYEKVKRSAERLLDAPPVKYELNRRGEMLGPCQEAVSRVYALGLVHRLEGDGRFGRRLAREILSAAELSDWNPKHFLDLAELTHATAIGYDWAYGELSEEERARVREGIVHKGLIEGLREYRTPWPFVAEHMNFNWSTCKNNWNQVCNGGMVMGALAVAEDEPQLAGEVVAGAMRSIKLAMREFAPDGGWGEGPGYWEYGTRYNVLLLAALETAAGEAAIRELIAMSGFDKTGEFRLHLVAPTGLAFNFGDARDGKRQAPQMFWLARKFGRPEYAWEAERSAAPTALDIIWYGGEGKSPKEEGLARAAYFRRVEAACLRSAWDDENAVYVGFKGGDNGYNHSHADLGTFVLDADGQRWALDLGPDDYGLAGYFVTGKMLYYRQSTAGHNTVILDGQNQGLLARAPIVGFRCEKERAFAAADLSEGYGLAKGGLRRGVALAGREVLIQDELRAQKETEVWWQMHTRAQISVEGGRRALLQQGGKALSATILSPAGATFQVREANAPPPQGQQPDVKKLVIALAVPAGETRIAVAFVPGGGEPATELRPLDEWIAEAREAGGR
ncbi:MAG: heparinase II/III family protein [Planctomycetota bacterium]